MKYTSFFKPPLGPPKEVLSIWCPKGSFFPFGTPKEKKLLMGGRTGANFLIFFGNFFKHVKKLFNFWNFEKMKVAKSKLNHLG